MPQRLDAVSENMGGFFHALTFGAVRRSDLGGVDKVDSQIT